MNYLGVQRFRCSTSLNFPSLLNDFWLWYFLAPLPVWCSIHILSSLPVLGYLLRSHSHAQIVSVSYQYDTKLCLLSEFKFIISEHIDRTLLFPRVEYQR
ncbi:hypothetical protein C8R44DRAFT_395281 [Mycena epipterygia]|nr:hypothetical protein C8R44DRAFT_395281 [Mycena epipterygia]